MTNIFNGPNGKRNKIVAGAAATTILFSLVFVGLRLSSMRSDQSTQDVAITVKPDVINASSTTSTEESPPAGRINEYNYVETVRPKEKNHDDAVPLGPKEKSHKGHGHSNDATTRKSTTTSWSTTPFPGHYRTTTYY